MDDVLEELVWLRRRNRELEAEVEHLRDRRARNYQVNTHVGNLTLVWSAS